MDRISKGLVIALAFAGVMLGAALIDRTELKAQVGLCVGLVPAVSEMVEARARILGKLDELNAAVGLLLDSDPSTWRREDLLLVQAQAVAIRRGT